MVRGSIVAVFVVVVVVLAVGCGVLGSSPEEAAAEHRVAGREASQRGALTLAIEEFTQAIELDAMAGDYIGRAFAHAGRGELESAFADIGLAIALDGESAAAFYLRARLLGDLGRWEEALVDLDRTIELRPGRPDQHQQRALTHRNLGDLEAAIADTTVAIELDPESSFVRVLLSDRGAIYLELGRFEEALGDLERSVELGLDRGGTRVLLAAVLAGLGRDDEARVVLEGALGLVLDPIERLQIETALDALEGSSTP